MIRVLVADDHAVMAEALARCIDEAEDMECIAVAMEGQSAIEQAQETSPDVALLDLDMPGLTGLEAAGALTQSQPDVAVVILTALRGDMHALRAFRSGASGYLMKTLSPADLQAAIRQVHAGAVVITPEIAEALEVDRETSASEKSNLLQRLNNGVRLGGRKTVIIEKLSEGLTTPEIAEDLHVSESTVKTYIHRSCRYLGVSTRAELVAQAIARGLIDAPRYR